MHTEPQPCPTTLMTSGRSSPASQAEGFCRSFQTIHTFSVTPHHRHPAIFLTGSASTPGKRENEP